ncbi:MAG: BlaI/MecI/CopY family transcriptional regulator [Bacteroidaceae bacterium]|nr:BlaI/MecI/CopY family transcriptional regulator [Bacteroidaceae bacterium]
MAETKKRIQELTRAELEIMQVVWKIGHEFVVRDVHELLPDPKPAYSTVSTIVRILDTKGFLSHKTYGHSNVYQAAVSKEDYTDSYMHGVLNSFFGGSVSRLVNYFSQRNSISVEETDEILRILDDDKK